jgi:ADP-ribosylglycohydrolase
MKISGDIYKDKIKACWMGKALGGGIGAPYEGVPYKLNLTRQDIYLDQGPNDDLELQLLWMIYAEKFGLKLDSAAISGAWLKHIKYDMDEYGAAMRNMKRGLTPPLTGAVDNWFVDGMGAAIRAEIWGCLAPGRPELAAYFASQDASVDHCGDGVWAEMFIAAANSAAFVSGDIVSALNEGLKHIPQDCRLARGINFVFGLRSRNLRYSELHGHIMDEFGRHNFTDCVMGVCFIVAALLYGENDFEQTILNAVNFGMDTDCTGASCGALLGVIHGSKFFPDYLTEKMNSEITVSDFLATIPGLPRSIDEFTSRIAVLAEKIDLEIESGNVKAFPEYIPVTYNKADLLPPAYWLVMPHVSESEASKIEQNLMLNGPDTGLYPECREVFYGTMLDLSKYADHFNHIHLFSFVKIPEDRDDAVIMACADTGITAWIDGLQKLNYHGRQLALPAFHRTEGGGTFTFPMKKDKYYLIHVRLLFCRKPLTLSVAAGDINSRYICGAEYKI